MLAPLQWLALDLVPTDWLALDFALADWLTLGVLLLAALAIGICVHELLHVVPLRFIGADYTVTVLPADGEPPTADKASTTDDTLPTVWATLQSALTGGLVRVEVTHLPRDAPDWVVRVAALLPVVLAVPMLLVAAGVLPDPVAVNDHLTTVLVVAAAACGLPSPADWAVVWHGSRLYRRD